MKMGVDIETYSSVDLQKAGVRPYTEAPDFTILLIGYRVDDQPTRIIDLADSEDADLTLLPPVLSDLPAGDLDEFLCLLTSPEVVKTAYNASFERTCLARYFARPMLPEQWRCTMVQAATLGLPGTLAQVGAALGLEKQKLTEGAELIRYFCKPAKDGTRHYPKDAPDKWERFRKYNVRDVDVETDIRDRLARWPRPPAELAAWELDQRINDRGVRLDAGLLDKALELDGQYSARLMAEARQLTALGNPNSDAQLKGWLAGRGLVTDSLDKNAIPSLLEAAPDDTTRRVLQLRQELGKTSVKKYEAMERGRCQDGRVHNLLQFYGAGRTGRWAGRLVQVQNLPQNKLNDLSTARELVKNGEFDLLELAYGSPPFVLSQLIRTTFIPSEGCRFIIADYSAIEARVLAWLAGGLGPPGVLWGRPDLRGHRLHDVPCAQGPNQEGRRSCRSALQGQGGHAGLRLPGQHRGADPDGRSEIRHPGGGAAGHREAVAQGQSEHRPLLVCGGGGGDQRRAGPPKHPGPRHTV